MNQNNKLRLTWIGFSCGLTGAPGDCHRRCTRQHADHFQLPVSSMSNTFTFLNSSILAVIFLNVWMMEIIPLKWPLMFGCLLMVLGVLRSTSCHNLIVFSLSMFVLSMVRAALPCLSAPTSSPICMRDGSATSACCLPTRSCSRCWSACCWHWVPSVARYGVGAALQTFNLLLPYITVFILCPLLDFVSRHRTHTQAIV
ncbi:MAG: Protein TsgA [Sodalis sp.]|nr:MAG: Protein TsgA [Sodalis sp.]